MKYGTLLLAHTLACLTILLAPGCASSKPMTWTGPKVMEGTGGVAEKVDGIDFYRSGSPNGNFEVLSVIETHHYTGGNLAWNSMAASSSRDKAIEEAKRLGAEAVVPYDVRESRFGGGTTAYSGTTYVNPTGGPSIHTGTAHATAEKASVNTVYLIVKPVR